MDGLSIDILVQRMYFKYISEFFPNRQNYQKNTVEEFIFIETTCIMRVFYFYVLLAKDSSVEWRILIFET